MTDHTTLFHSLFPHYPLTFRSTVMKLLLRPSTLLELPLSHPLCLGFFVFPLRFVVTFTGDVSSPRNCPVRVDTQVGRDLNS